MVFNFYDALCSLVELVFSLLAATALFLFPSFTRVMS